MLHPFFRGALLNNFDGAWQRVQKDFIQQNEVEPEPEVIPMPVDKDLEDDQDHEFFDSALKFSQNLEAARPTQGRREGALTPLIIELETYLELPRLNISKVEFL